MAKRTKEQKRFDDTYISSSEICKRLGIARCQLLVKRNTGYFPEPIQIANIPLSLWERKTVEPLVIKWRAELIASRKKRKTNAG